MTNTDPFLSPPDPFEENMLQYTKYELHNSAAAADYVLVKDTGVLAT